MGMFDSINQQPFLSPVQIAPPIMPAAPMQIPAQPAPAAPQQGQQGGGQMMNSIMKLFGGGKQIDGGAQGSGLDLAKLLAMIGG